jgi:hypothetical protein
VARLAGGDLWVAGAGLGQRLAARGELGGGGLARDRLAGRLRGEPGGEGGQVLGRDAAWDMIPLSREPSR